MITGHIWKIKEVLLHSAGCFGIHGKTFIEEWEWMQVKSTTTEREIQLCSLSEGNTKEIVQDYALGQTDRQILHHESCRHDYSVAPSAALWKTHIPASQQRPIWMIDLLQHSNSLLLPNIIYPNEHPNVHAPWEYSLQGPVGATKEDVHDYHYHASGGLALLVWLHHPQLWSLLASCDNVSGTLGTQIRPCAPMSRLPK